MHSLFPIEFVLASLSLKIHVCANKVGMNEWIGVSFSWFPQTSAALSKRFESTSSWRKAWSRHQKRDSVLHVSEECAPVGLCFCDLDEIPKVNLSQCLAHI